MAGPAVGDSVRMQPGPQQRFLHYVLRALPVTARQMQRVSQ
jgi:hypothetical protein